MLRHTDIKEVIGDSQHGFMKGKLCLNKFGDFLQQAYSTGGQGKSDGHHLPGLVQSI